MVSKKAITTTKKSVVRGRAAAASTTSAQPRAPRAYTAKPKVAPSPKKIIAKPRTPSLVNAVPMSTVAPQKPEQVLYEPALAAGDAPTQTASDASTADQAPKRGRGRPRKNPLLTTGTTATTQPTAVSAASPSQPIAPAQVATPEPVPSAASTAAVPPAITPVPPASTSHPLSAHSPAAVTAQAPVRSRRGWHINRRLLTILSIFVVLLAGAWYWHAAHAESSASANAKLVAEIGKHVVLPKGETPTVTTVVDETKVNQDFLKNAKKGDKVLLYFQSSQAIVYRPSTGQVVNMGPLQTPRPRVFIRQGAAAANVAGVKDIISHTNGFLVASQDQSASQGYDKTIVVDLTGNRPDLAGQLAQLLHVNVGNLPEGEIPPDADLMVIVGSDFK